MKDTYKNLKLYTFSDDLKKIYGVNQKAVIFGNFGALNYGDEALLAGQLEEFKKIPNSTVTVISRFPKIVQKVHSVASVSLVNIVAVVWELIKCDYVIFGGGGLFCKNTSGFRGIIFQFYTTVMFLLLPILLSKKVYAIGIGFYSNTPSIIMLLAIPLLRFASKCTVRDEHSYIFLRSKRIKVDYYKDNSFLMPVDTKEVVKNYFFTKEIYDKKKVNIAMALKQPNKIEERKLIAEITNFINLYKDKAVFWLYSLDTHPYYPSDSEVNKKIASIVKKGTTIHFIPERLTPKVLFSSFQLMDFVIAMRLHSMIFAYRLKIPMVGIDYDKKCKSFMHSIGGISVDLAKVESKFIISAFESLKR